MSFDPTIHIPDKTIQGRAVNFPGNPNHGTIQFKNKSGVIVPPQSGLPNWVTAEFIGDAYTVVPNFFVIPNPTRKTWYVSFSNGSDVNSGETPLQAFKTISRALAASSGADHIRLRRSDRWDDQSLHPLTVSGNAVVKNGISSSERTVITFYGNNGPRPMIASDDTVINTFNRGGLRHLILDGIHFYSKNKDPLSPTFVDGDSRGAGLRFRSGNTHDITLHDCIFDYAEITVESVSKDNQWPGYPSDIRIINNIFTGAYDITTYYSKNSRPSNLFVEETIGLTVTGNVFDYGGWNPFVPGASANMYNHNVYLKASSNPAIGNSYFFHNNIITRGSSHGIHGRPGGSFVNNFFSRNSINLQVGYSSTPLGAGTTPLVEDNVVSECWSMWKGYNNDSMFNSSYPDDPMRSGAKWGFNFENYANALITARNNISQIGYVAGDDYARINTNVRGWQLRMQPLHVDQNNIVWQFPNQTGSYPDPGRTLATYENYLNGSGTFDTFMTKVKNRPLRCWDDRYTAIGINNFIRGGYNP